MASELTLTVNGAKQVVSAAPETPLIFVLRNELKLSGPRLGCGMAQCGACAVLLDGKEIRAAIDVSLIFKLNNPRPYIISSKLIFFNGQIDGGVILWPDKSVIINIK